MLYNTPITLKYPIINDFRSLRSKTINNKNFPDASSDTDKRHTLSAQKCVFDSRDVKIYSVI